MIDLVQHVADALTACAAGHTPTDAEVRRFQSLVGALLSTDTVYAADNTHPDAWLMYSVGMLTCVEP
jgi:hypothetical protein